MLFQTAILALVAAQVVADNVRGANSVDASVRILLKEECLPILQTEARLGYHLLSCSDPLSHYCAGETKLECPWG